MDREITIKVDRFAELIRKEAAFNMYVQHLQDKIDKAEAEGRSAYISDEEKMLFLTQPTHAVEISQDDDF